MLSLMSNVSAQDKDASKKGEWRREASWSELYQGKASQTASSQALCWEPVILQKASPLLRHSTEISSYITHL